MKEHPILFQGAMVRALLAGTKTQTRRILKQAVGPSLSVGYDEDSRHPGEAVLSWLTGPGPGYDVEELIKYVKCPYGKPTDRLWVREAIRLVPDQEPDDGTGRVLSAYDADHTLTVADAWPWKRSYLPPMHCPRGLSRMDLEITEVRVERLQDISEADAMAEGIIAHRKGGWHTEQPPAGIEGSNHFGFKTARDAYGVLWESINGPGSWDANPWVWAVSFKRTNE